MCTVSYLPLPDGGYILTSNRDESPERHSPEIQTKMAFDKKLYYPEDPDAGGTWLCMADTDQVACLLNGAFEPFTKREDYRKSRGHVVLDYFSFPDFEQFSVQYKLNDIAPFTLVICEAGTICQLIWDGENAHIESLDPGSPHFWSSVTLYPEPVRTWRKKLFNKWLSQNPSFSQEEIMAFHTYGGKGDHDNAFVMNRNEVVKTLSISSVQQFGSYFQLKHMDLSGNSLIEMKIAFQAHSEVVQKT